MIYHTIYHANSTWPNCFGLVESEVSGGPTRGFNQISCGGVGTTLELVGVGNNGQHYHTIRNPNGTWQNYFGLIEGQVSGGPSNFTSVATGGVGTDLDIVGGTTSSGWL